MQRSGITEHVERLIAKSIDKLGWICVSRSGKRGRQRGKKHKYGDQEKAAQQIANMLQVEVGRPVAGLVRKRCLHKVLSDFGLYPQIDWNGDS